MKRQEEGDRPSWPQGVCRILRFGALNVVLSKVSGGRISLLPRTKIKQQPYPAPPTNPLTMSPSRPIREAPREPDLLDEICMIYGINHRPPRRR
jgi:hypothetical protein